MSAITPHNPGALAVSTAGVVNSALASAGYLDAVTQGTVNLVSPVFSIDSVPSGARLSIRAVRVLPADTYTPRKGDSRVALKKTALDVIAGAAQIDWTFCGQVDEWNDPHRVKYHAVAVVRNPDGTTRRLPGTKVLDLRKGGEVVGEDAIGMTDSELGQARKHIHSLAESKAKNRAIRSLGIPQSMTPAEAARPWVVVALVPDSNDPEMKAALIKSLAPARAILYGHTQTEVPRALPAEIQAGEDPDGDLVDLADMPEAPRAAMPTDPDPWDSPDPCPLPIGEQVFAAVPTTDEPRMKYLAKINAIFADLKASNRSADAIARKLCVGADWLAAPLSTIAEIGKALKAEIGGGR